MAECGKSLLSAAEALRILFGNAATAAESAGIEFSIPTGTMLYRALCALAESKSHVDYAEALNGLVRLTPHCGLIEALEDEFFEMLIANKLDIVNLLKPHTVDFEQIEFYRQNFLDLEQGIVELRKNLDSPRINPAVKACLAGKSILSENAEKIVEIALMRDPFARSRTFRYLKGKFVPCSVKNIPVNKFYGFHAVRGQFSEHLSNFAAGKGNVPLLVSSLPGLGKTQFSINYTLDSPELTLIFAEPETLSQDLEELIELLALRKRRKFAVFFDDIEPENINWYNFRTNVGGSAVLPENITFILASNYHFPINILSRGREITFPVFDEIRCLEMVEDFLLDFGMKNADENLASVIAAGYIEDFGQKKFTELSPRTLIRYLEKFRTDAPLRRKMLDMSRQEMIVRPDAQLFY
ncbi:MAG: hypothetical protein J6Q81_06250, partial [Lentisphaeria bacterium]|nr:hypothetical protein [Lentisphaeria bacterium]